jgi:hypothetical protein
MSFLRFVLVVALAASVLPNGYGQQPQVPTLTAVSLRRGNVIDQKSGAQSIGGVNYSSFSRSTNRVVAVKVRLSSFSKPKEPYEVQCFFIAKEPSQGRYIYDTKKMISSQQSEEFDVYARELFGGSQSVQSASSTRSSGGSFGGGNATRVTTTNRMASSSSGSKSEGWIVRVLSGGKVVRMEASLQELKSFAEKESAQLDARAAGTKESR